MSRTKLLLDVVSDMRSLADSLETIANAVAGSDGISKKNKLISRALHMKCCVNLRLNCQETVSVRK